MADKCEVIVIGAGAAGLAAACELAEAGIRTLVLEARDRIGGRVFTKYSDYTPIELGAEFIHGRPPETFALTERLGFETVMADWSPWHVTAEGELLPMQGYEPAGDEKVWAAMDEHYDANVKDVSLAKFLDDISQTGHARRIIESYVGGFHAAEVEKIGVRGLVKTERAGERIDGDIAFRLPAGYQALMEALRECAETAGAEIRCETVVDRVEWKTGGVNISTNSGDFSAPKAIVTLPIGVLKATQVVFDPAPDSKQAAIEKIESGAAVRISFYFKTKWWMDILRRRDPECTTLGFLFARQQFVPVWWANEPSHAAVLTGWAGGQKAKELCSMTEREMINQAIACMATIFGVECGFISEHVVDVHSHNWQQDPFSLGSYSYIKTDGEDAALELSRPLEDTLFFAGEATSFDGHWGTVHGALASGYRAAREIKVSS